MNFLYNRTEYTSGMDPDDVGKLKGSNHRVLFQNSEGNINMGVYFNDPDVEWSDIHWYNTLGEDIVRYKKISDNGLISYDKELDAYSCYVELHRKGKWPVCSQIH